MLAEFTVAYPGWVRRSDGAPLSYPLFMVGLAHLARAHARTSLRTAGAVGIGYAKEDVANKWFRIQQTVAGW
jgi:hypothetical protein